MPALTIRIPADARSALQDLAQAECRSPRDQAAFLVIEGLRAAALTGRGRQDRSVSSRPTKAPEVKP
jgi:hypothetical protein